MMLLRSRAPQLGFALYPNWERLNLRLLQCRQRIVLCLA